MNLVLFNLVFLLAIVVDSAWSWASSEGFSRRQLLKVAGYASFGLVAAQVVAEDAVDVSPVEVAAVGDAKKVRGNIGLTSSDDF